MIYLVFTESSTKIKETESQLVVVYLRSADSQGKAKNKHACAIITSSNGQRR